MRFVGSSGSRVGARAHPVRMRGRGLAAPALSGWLLLATLGGTWSAPGLGPLEPPRLLDRALNHLTVGWSPPERGSATVFNLVSSAALNCCCCPSAQAAHVRGEPALSQQACPCEWALVLLLPWRGRLHLVP